MNNYIVTFEYRVMVTAFAILAMFNLEAIGWQDHLVSFYTLIIACQGHISGFTIIFEFSNGCLKFCLKHFLQSWQFWQLILAILDNLAILKNLVILVNMVIYVNLVMLVNHVILLNLVFFFWWCSWFLII